MYNCSASRPKIEGKTNEEKKEVLPKLIELWGMNIRTDVEAKKNFMQQTVK